MVKFFLDANTLISGLLFEGNEARLLDLGRMGLCELFANEYVREEVRDVLGRSHLALSATEQGQALALLGRSVTVLSDPSPGEVAAARGRLADVEDLPVLAGFERSECDFLVTGDRRFRMRVPRAVTTRNALAKILAGLD